MGALGAPQAAQPGFPRGWAGGRRLRYKESDEAIWTPPAAQTACEDICAPHAALHSEPPWGATSESHLREPLQELPQGAT